jgi:hypothetical protein
MYSSFQAQGNVSVVRTEADGTVLQYLQRSLWTNETGSLNPVIRTSSFKYSKIERHYRWN